MTTFAKLLDLAGGRPLPQEEDGPATRLRLMVGAGLASAVLTAIYGLAAGSTDLALALGNVFKVPMVVVLSALAAVPATMLTWKLTGAADRCSDLLMSLAAANLTGALVLAVLSPVVALYYHTSGWLGGVLAAGTCSVALLVAIVALVRGVRRRAPSDVGWPVRSVPVVVMVVMQLAVMVQLIHVVAPILPERTVLEDGMDGVLAG